MQVWYGIILTDFWCRASFSIANHFTAWLRMIDLLFIQPSLTASRTISPGVAPPTASWARIHQLSTKNMHCRPIWWACFLSWYSLFQNDFSLCQFDTTTVFTIVYFYRAHLCYMQIWLFLFCLSVCLIVCLGQDFIM